MSLYDWNANGKKDFADDYIEYNIYRECTRDDTDNYSDSNCSDNSSGDISGGSIWLCVIIGIILLIMFN